MPLNCAAMPEHLLESEMFGHRKGAFTGADRDKVGLLEVANGGTFFLDELTEMPLPLQAKLLRVMQDGVVRRVGSEQQDAVSRRPLHLGDEPRSARGDLEQNLREDLFYRLNVFPITLPPLRERVEDIPILANHFLQQFWARHRSTQDALPRFSDGGDRFPHVAQLAGNVRELQNVIEHVVVLAQPGSQIEASDIPAYQDCEPAAEAEGSQSERRRAQRRVSSREGARAGELREGVRHAPGRARIWQHVARRATGERRSNDVVSVARAPRVPARDTGFHNRVVPGAFRHALV